MLLVTKKLDALKPAIDDGETAELLIVLHDKPYNIVYHVIKDGPCYIWGVRGIPKEIGEPTPVKKVDIPYDSWGDLLSDEYRKQHTESDKWILVQ